MTFRDITPQWFEWLNKTSKEEKDDDETLFRLYFEINDYKRCIIGEAYGYDESYVIQGTKRYCQVCIALSPEIASNKNNMSRKLVLLSNLLIQK